ncbi:MULTISPECIES: CAF17-like 4Fe-4S cluster assembly/insertion protein YgfZ [Halomicrobium]|uniref:Folate-binding protein YgfZ n=2 Tax=Halomicrobium mukohataei TaxID=57705 RepID=C7NX38_HALMD|nr:MULTISPECIES: aminomethyltransferase family protein [Halomicrobium]ACV46403.1 folate-binding protein YgfZ [Halomicrobium mukohataei DSM 12286]QCD64955.1 aminomethyl transferase family protein [Halomicrobium mukohataei]QFR19761.1 aminomethyl transferase family protein [Halomicrobium sp. ZPS1]
MTVIEGVHEDRGATFRTVGGNRVVANYGRPERVHRAVRQVVGVIEMGYGVVTVTGDDRIDFVDNAVSNRVPTADGDGVYSLLLDPQGHVETELYVYNAGERLLLFVPPARADPLVEDWREKTFIQDVTIADATDEFAVFGVHGPKATEKIASVLNKTATPETPLSFVRGSMVDAGVTVVRSDGLVGEEGFEVVCSADVARDVYDTLENRGLNAAPFGYDTWDALTLEAGTPLFDTEIEGQIPNVVGLANGVDFEKGCFVGQEVVSRVHNRGRPSKRLVGLTCGAVPESGAAVFVDDASVGAVTRAVESPTREEPIALARVDYELPDGTPSVRVDGGEVDAELAALPFVTGSDESARLPRYER